LGGQAVRCDGCCAVLARWHLKHGHVASKALPCHVLQRICRILAG
jgi:hypothetical protein